MYDTPKCDRWLQGRFLWGCGAEVGWDEAAGVG